MLLIAILFFVLLFMINSSFETFIDNCKKQENCSEDKYCDLSNRICTKKIELNNTCTNSYECKYGICNVSMNRCSTINTGEPCNYNLDCTSKKCDGSKHCS